MVPPISSPPLTENLVRLSTQSKNPMGQTFAQTADGKGDFSLGRLRNLPEESGLFPEKPHCAVQGGHVATACHSGPALLSSWRGELGWGRGLHVAQAEAEQVSNMRTGTFHTRPLLLYKPLCLDLFVRARSPVLGVPEG